MTSSLSSPWADMSEPQQFDVVVVGGGIAGLVAANRAAQLNLKAVVLEQGEDEKYLCNTRFTGGTLHICLREITLDEETLRLKILESGGGFIQPEIAQVIAREGRRVVRWLQDEGMRFMRASASEYHKWVLAPPGRSRPGLDWEGRAGDVLLRTLEARLISRGGKVVRGARADTLIMDGGRCVGVVAEQRAGKTPYRARAVFIADGGFSGNAELVERYVSRRPERLKQRGAGTGKGDGMRMAEAAGAALVGMDRFYGHTLSVDAMKNDMLWPYPQLDLVAAAGVLVDRSGKRFSDEGLGGVFMANIMARQQDPQGIFAVWDEVIWQDSGRAAAVPPNPTLERHGGTLRTANTIAELAVALGVDPAGLEKTVRDYNDAVTSNRLGTLSPARSAKRRKAEAIVKAPFYGAPACSGITYTMGGIRIDGQSRVLRPDRSPIPGLYAAGASTGGLEGGPCVGYVGGLMKGIVFGMLAAESIAGKR